MSLLMFSMHPDGIVVVTDTMACDTDRLPAKLVSKCAVVPNLELLIAGTGSAELADRWRHVVYSNMLCRDIDMIDQHTPGELRRIAGELVDEFGDIAVEITSTIYHFGRSESRDRYVGYAYRSADDFASEPLPESGFGVKPPPESGSFDSPMTLEEWISLAELIRAEDDAKPRGDRVGIGGELVMMNLNERVISVRKVHQFEGFEELWLKVNERLGSESVVMDAERR